MKAKRESALVGLFVLVACALLVTVTFVVSGVLTSRGNRYRTYFSFSGGLEPGQVVRVGGIKSGRIHTVRIDPQDSARVEILFQMDRGTPVKADSVAMISSLSPLGDNYLEITPGSRDAPRLEDGATVPGEPYVSFNDLMTQLSKLTPEARQVIASLNQTVLELNGLLTEENRENVAASLVALRGLLEESRPEVREVLDKLHTASSELLPLLDELRETTRKADQSLAEVASLLGDDRPDLDRTIGNLRETSETTSRLVRQLNDILLANAGGIDETIDNVRILTENLRELTDRIKARPASLIFSAAPEERRPGEPPRR